MIFSNDCSVVCCTFNCAARSDASHRTGSDVIQLCIAAPSGRVCLVFYPDLEGVSGLRDYETVIIWSASIPEAEIEKEHDHVVEIIKGDDSTYTSSQKWGRRMLAYPIKKQTEGIYHFLKWNGNPDTISAIDKYLRINEGCLRYITLRADDDEESENRINNDDFFEGDEMENGGE